MASLIECDIETINQHRAKVLLELWMVRAHKAARAHYTQAATHKDRNRNLTLTNASLAIGVLFFTNTNWVKDMFVHVLQDVGASFFYATTSVLALFVVLTTILQFTVRWGERSEQHRFAGAAFSNLQKKCERYALVDKLKMSMIHNLNRDYNHITKSYPLVNSKIWKISGVDDLNNRIESLEAFFRCSTAV